MLGYSSGMSSGIGDRVRQARKKRGLSQDALARALEVSKNTIFRWEAGEVTPRGTNLDRLAQVLGVTSDWLMRGQERASGEAPDPPHWREFVERYQHLDELAPEQVEDIKRFAARNFKVRSWTDFERIAEIVRTSQPSPTFEAKRRRE